VSSLTTNVNRRVEVNAFVRATFGLRGTLALHRFAFGADLLRAPANVLLAPIFLVTRLIAFVAKAMRFHKASAWMSRRKVLLETNVSRQVAVRVLAFVKDIEAKGDDIAMPHEVLEYEIAEYSGVRSAVGEITTTFMIIVVGYFLFQTVTPGVISITGPVAELRAHSLAITQFPLGQGLGGMYYAVFSTDPEPWKLVVTGVVLAMLASVVTTFAGVIADPLQVMTGTHRRRLCRLFDRLEIASDRRGNIAREHITARFADLTDIALNLWRILRG
jgi:hypothetical protein